MCDFPQKEIMPQKEIIPLKIYTQSLMLQHQLGGW